MKNGFRKLLATLCALALLLTSITAVLADGEGKPEDPEQTVLETTAVQPAEEEKEAEEVIPEASETPEEAEIPADNEEPAENMEPDENETLPEENEPQEKEGAPETDESQPSSDANQTNDMPVEAESGLPGSDLPSEPEAEDVQSENNDPADNANNDNEIVSDSTQNETIPESDEGANPEEEPADESANQPEENTDEITEKPPEETADAPEEKTGEQPEEQAEPEEGTEEMTEEPSENEEEIQTDEKPENPEATETAEDAEETANTEETENTEATDDMENMEDAEDTEADEETEKGEKDDPAGDLNELHPGTKGISGTLKAGETYVAVLTSEYNYNLVLTLTLRPINGGNPIPAGMDGANTGLKVMFADSQKELTWVENEEPDSADVIYQFTAYADKEKTYEIRISSQFDAEFTLSAARKQEEKKETAEQEEPIQTEEETEEVTEEETAKESEEIGTEDETPDDEEELDTSDIEEDIPDTMPPDEELLAMGYYKVQILKNGGADLFPAMDENTEPSEHLDLAEELWVKPTEDRAWAEIYGTDGGKYLFWNDVLITSQEKQQDDEAAPSAETEEAEKEEPYARSVSLSSTLDGVKSIEEGTLIIITATLEGFREDDLYTISWFCSSDSGETYNRIDSAEELEFRYFITEENAHNIWKIVISLE